MKRTATPTFVLTIPLVVKSGEDRILIGRMEACGRLYNTTIETLWAAQKPVLAQTGWRRTGSAKIEPSGKNPGGNTVRAGCLR